MDFQVGVKVTEWKVSSSLSLTCTRTYFPSRQGQMSGRGHEAEYTFESVRRIQNLLFDINLYIIAFLWGRGCFGDMVSHATSVTRHHHRLIRSMQSIEEIYTSDTTEILILEDRLEEPL